MNYDFWDYFFTGLFLFILGSLISVVCFLVYDEVQWANAPTEEVQCSLINQEFQHSTQKAHAVPSVGMNGSVSMGFVTTGDPEATVTVWDCGNIGRFVSKDEGVFRFAKPVSTLIMQHRGAAYRIKGIRP